MKVTARVDISDIHDGRTLYTVQLDNGREVDVMRKHLTGLVYVMEPHPENVNERSVIAFLRGSEYSADFSAPV